MSHIFLSCIYGVTEKHPQPPQPIKGRGRDRQTDTERQTEIFNTTAQQESFIVFLE